MKLMKLMKMINNGVDAALLLNGFNDENAIIETKQQKKNIKKTTKTKRKKKNNEQSQT